MTPDTPTNPHEDAPTSGSETLVPTPETETAPPEDQTATLPQTEPDAIAPEPQNAPEPQIAPSSGAQQSLPATKPIAPELLEEFAASQQAPDETPTPQPVAIETAQPQAAPEAPSEPAAPAENPALALTFAPAPDAPFQSSVTVGIACQTSGARIFYTLDGTQPDQTSTAYDKDKILLTQSAMLSARAFGGSASGAVASADYIVSKPMWQENEPADPTDPTPHKASENQGAPDNWQSAAASVRGKLHAHRALWREDAFALADVETPGGNWSVIAVSDGAGSAPLSRIGSRIACDQALQSLNGSLAQIDALSDDAQTLAADDLPRLRAALVGAASDALASIGAEADKRGRPMSAFAATLLILVRRAWNDKQLCAAIQVGDGAIALDCASGLKMLGEADHGQHSSETRFLTTGGIEASLPGRVKFSLPDDLRAILVVSDGVSDDYFPEDKRLTEVFEAVTPLAQSADDAGAALLDWLGYEKKGSSDDRTLALSWPAETDAVAALEAELAADEMAGLASASDLEDAAETRLEGGAGLASASNPGVNPQTRLEEDASPATDSSSSEQAIPTSKPEIAASEVGTSASEVGTSASEVGTSEIASATPAISDDVAAAATEMRDGG